MKRGWMVALAAVSLTLGCAEETGDAEPGTVVVIPDEPEEPGQGTPDPGEEPLPDPGTDPEVEEPPEPMGLPILGAGYHDIEHVEMTEIGTWRDGLNVPRDLDFNPWSDQPELWVVNRSDDSTTTFFEPGTESQTSLHLIDPFAMHFMEEVSSIAFGDKGTFGTCQESRNSYNGQAEPNDFMGPSLWPSDFDIYARSNPDAVAFLGYDLGSHLDMQHESPLCMGIAWEADNVYWVFEGLTSSIARNDFQEDHGPGFDDHSDGIVIRYAEGEVSRVPDVPSHLEYDHATERLYIADTGNARVAMLDTAIGRPGLNLPVAEPGTVLRMATETEPLQTIFEHPELERPSGLVLRGDVLFVGDNATGRIWAVNTSGEVLDYLDTRLKPGALMGMVFGPDGALWIADAVDHRVLRIRPLPEG